MEEKYMKIALKEAKKAYNKDEIPVGAVIIKNGEVVAKAYNLKETKQDTTNHAEILAIKKASKKLNHMLLFCNPLRLYTLFLSLIVLMLLRTYYMVQV